MAKLKVEQFVDLVKRSGLVDDEKLSEALSGVDQSVSDSGIVASNLTKAGLLTEWQSEKLLQGRHKGFYLGKYKLLSHIGTGGMGSVYLAEHQVMRHRVAIKLLPTNLASQTSYIERFHQEARAAAALAHPNIIRAFDVDQHEAYHYLVMEFVDGTDIQAIVSRSGPLPYDTAASYTRQAAEGLGYAHRMGLIHRDIKPANLLVNREGTVKILDMGLARFSDDSQGSLTKEYDQKMIGTVDYLAPEQALDSHGADGRADIYSLGCTLYFMLTGDSPFPQGTIPQRLMQHQSQEPRDIRETRPDAPQELIDICRKMMAKKVTDRYQTGEEVARDLAIFLGEDVNGFSSSDLLIPPPSGPSQNENLDLAPIDEDETGSRRRLSDSSAGKSNPSASGVSGSGASNSSVMGGASTKPGSGASKSSSGIGKSNSGVRSGAHKTVKPGSSPGKPKSDVQSGPAQPAPKIDLAPAEDDIMEELLSSTSLPEVEQQLPAAPLHPIGSRSSGDSESIGMRLGKLAGLAIGGAIAVVILILVLVWISVNF